MADGFLSAGDGLQFFRRLNVRASAGDGLTLNWLAMARNGCGLQVYARSSARSNAMRTCVLLTTRDGVLEAMALASRTTGHVLGLGLGGQVLGLEGQVLSLGRRVLGLGLGKHVLALDHFRLMCLVLCTLY